MLSLVEGEHPVAEGEPEGGDTVHTPEATVLFVYPAEEGLMSTIAEGCVRAHLAVAQLVVARFGHIESDGSAAGNDPLALTVAQGGVLGVTARAPVVGLPTVQVHVRGEQTGEGRQRGRPVLALLVGARLIKHNHLLLREVSHIIHSDLCTRSIRL